MLEDFLSKLGASTRITVGVSVSPGVGLEMIEIDRLTKTVNKYSSRPLEYNNSTREITDYDQFRTSLEELFEDLNIPRKSNIVLSLPNVHFGMINLPILLTDEAITNAIVSEVEQSYIFKRQEPVVSWSEVFSNSTTENRTLAYTAIQKEALERISEACDEIGCTLVGLENSYCSLFRALDYLEVAKEQMKENVSWNLMVIMQNNYSIISMNGKQVVEYYEEPLALKSFVDDEIYNAIKTSAQLTLAGLPANYLYIVSETDLVSAEVLSMGLPSDYPIEFLECNKFIQNELLPINLNVLQKKGMQITPEAIGVATYTFNDFPLKLNIIKDQDGFGLLGGLEECPKVNIGNLEVELTPKFIKKISLIIGAIILIPTILSFLFLNNIIVPKEQARLQDFKAKVDGLNKSIEKYQDASQDNTFDVKTAVQDIVTGNKFKMSYFDALGISVPNKLWVTDYKLSGKGKVDIKGVARDVTSVYSFYKSMKQIVDNSDIRLYKLEVNSGSIDDFVVDNKGSSNLYQFEITNMSAAELAPPTETAAGTNPAATESSTASAPQEAKKSFFQFGKPLFGGTQTETPAAAPGAPAPMAAPQSTQPIITPPPITDNNGLPPNLRKIEQF